MRSVLSARLPDKVARELDRFAKSQGRSRSDVVKESISLYLWESRFEDGRKSLRMRAKKKDLVTDEDIFKEVS
ncbi:MAG TPA: ribbon-helix-helix protein, CopG family [Nitrospirota bacterium]|nr:ribbon-helix-helix protein, CopG family [Nitrospirota bacterium]